MEKKLVFITKLGVYAVLFLPLIVGTQFFFPFIVLKNVLFRVIVEVLFFCFSYPRYRPKFNLLGISVIAYVFIATITSISGISPLKSFWGNYERMGGIFHAWHILLYFIVLIFVFKEK